MLRRRGLVRVEPDPVNFRNLNVNLAANGLDQAVDAFELALSDEDGTTTLERSPSNAGDHRVRASADPPAGAPRETVEVGAGTLDGLIGAGRVDLDRVALAWIDVQGHEGHVLAGAGQLLERGIPMVVEYWPAGLRESAGHQRFLRPARRRLRELRRPRPPANPPGGEVLPSTEIGALDRRLAGPDDHADLLLVNPVI